MMPYSQVPRNFFNARLRRISQVENNRWVGGQCPICKTYERTLVANLVTGAYRCFACGAKVDSVQEFQHQLERSEQEMTTCGCVLENAKS